MESIKHTPIVVITTHGIYREFETFQTSVESVKIGASAPGSCNIIHSKVSGGLKNIVKYWKKDIVEKGVYNIAQQITKQMYRLDFTTNTLREETTYNSKKYGSENISGAMFSYMSTDDEDYLNYIKSHVDKKNYRINIIHSGVNIMDKEYDIHMGEYVFGDNKYDNRILLFNTDGSMEDLMDTWKRKNQPTLGTPSNTAKLRSKDTRTRIVTKLSEVFKIIEERGLNKVIILDLSCSVGDTGITRRDLNELYRDSIRDVSDPSYIA